VSELKDTKHNKPITTFIRFSKDTRKYVREIHPEYTKGDVSRELAHLWNNVISDEVKQEYRREYIIDMEQYNRDKLLFKIVKSKKPMTTFIRFSKDTRKYVRDANPSYGPHDVTKVLASMWNEEISNEVKEEYRRRYIIDMEQYTRDKLVTNHVVKLKKPMTTFIRFSKDTRKYVRESNPRYNRGEVTKELSRLWNEVISEQVKEEYRRRYIIDMEHYNNR
jgi:predicted RNase H-like nuclease